MKKKREFTRVYATIRRIARQTRRGESLPSIRHLAAAAQASTYTTWKVVEKLRAEKVLPEPEGASRQPGTGRHLWKGIAEKIENDVMLAFFPKGRSLPSLKELQARYAVSYPTLKKALSHACEHGFIERGMGGYFVPRPAVSARNFRLILLRFSADGQSPVEGLHDEEFIRILETRCAYARIRIEEVGYVVEKGATRFISLCTGRPSAIDSSETLLGIMLLIVNQGSAHPSVFTALSTVGKPVSILDEIGGWYNESAMPRHLHHRLIRIVGESAGRDMGRYCIEQGHKAVAFFSPLFAEQWAKDRYAELKAAFQSEKATRRVELFSIEGHERIWSYLDDGAQRAGIHTLIRSLTRWLEKTPDEFVFTIEPLLRFATREQCAKGEIYTRLIPLFTQALGTKDISAWVFDGDVFVTMALDFLHKHDVPVPEKIALFSFADSHDALQARITAYHFNISAAVNVMMDFLFYPNSFRWKRKNRIVNIEGTVIRRDSG